MTITSVGYKGQVNTSNFANIISRAGSQYGVFAPGDFAASAGIAAGEVKIAPGTAIGHGILDTSDAVESLTGDIPSSGVRWDLVALRRDWTAGSGTGLTSLVLVTGTATQQIPTGPTGRKIGDGVIDDQPQWLVKFEAGKTAPQAFIDLRVWHGDAGMWANHKMVLDYHQRIGSCILVQGTQWVRIIGAGGTAQWVSSLVLANDVTASRLRAASTSDASLTSTDHGFQVGPDNDLNVIVDVNEIMARSNGAKATLFVNKDGGDIVIGDGTSRVIIPGNGLTTKAPYSDLWSGGTGGYYMAADHTVNLSQPVADQQHGILLVWSRYVPGDANPVKNDTWSYTFVPRWHVTDLPSGGSTGVPCPVGNLESPFNKYVYVANSKITGIASNASDATSKSIVLRRVLGF